ncbi:MAG: ribosomal RNA small subunit methyltransferase A, partial [Lancefieldella parvula]
QVAATLILKFFQERPSLERAVVMVQAEVADRIAAKPSTKAYGAYTAKLSLFAQVTGRFEVGPGNFMPPPRVNSAVVRLDRTEARNPLTSEFLSEEELLHTMNVIDAAFAQRRKTIRNSMSASGFDKDKLDQAFLDTGIAPTVRAEVLTSQDFICFAAALEPLSE